MTVESAHSPLTFSWTWHCQR